MKNLYKQAQYAGIDVSSKMERRAKRQKRLARKAEHKQPRKS